MNADFAGAKIYPAADACRSSNRTLFGTGIFAAELLHIEKLDKGSISTNFHSNKPAISPWFTIAAIPKLEINKVAW